MYDVIGDIHGHAKELRQLLTKMDYSYNPSRGAWAHPTRKALYVSDFLDGGPDNLDAIGTAQNMIETGSALAVMGNHEFNAVHYSMPDGKGGFLRPHNEANNHQHKAFLDEVEGAPSFHADAIDFFKSIPVFFKEGPLHVIHACWHAASIETLQRNGAIDEQGLITPKGWRTGADKNSEDYQAFEILLKGPEENIGNGHSFADKYGTVRSKGRINWWNENPATYGEAYNLPPHADFADVPYRPSGPSALSAQIQEGLKDVPLLLFGHYWMHGDKPTLLSDRATCVDFSVARNGHLVAYRTQPGETKLDPKNFVWVPALG